ncbi:MAG: hypothetical protein ACLR8L_03225 [Oscillospiraceae bacterium]
MNYIATRDGVELLDENADSIYMRYIATRPRAEKHGEHGLFGAEDAVDLEKTLGELKAHEGNVWTIIYSLRREDAARLGYDNAASWRALLHSSRQISRKPCRFLRLSFAGMRRFTMRANIRIST